MTPRRRRKAHLQPRRKARPKAAPRAERRAHPASVGSLLQRRLDMVRRVSESLHGGMPYTEALKGVLTSVLEATDFEKAELYLADETTGFLAKEIEVHRRGAAEENVGLKISLHETPPAGTLEELYLRLLHGRKASAFADGRGREEGGIRGLSGRAVLALAVPGSSKRLGVLALSAEGRRPDAHAAVGMREAVEVCATQLGFLLENLRLHHDLVQAAFKDELTGQYNHRFFLKRLREEIDRSGRYGHGFTVVLLGLDRFSEFNRTFGYSLGDRVLQELGGHLQRNVRSCDVAARLAGDEFGLLLPETPLDGARVVAEKFRKAVESFAFTSQEGLRDLGHPLTASLAVSEYPVNGLILEQILEGAREALFAAKEAGGNAVRVSETKVEVIEEK